MKKITLLLFLTLPILLMAQTSFEFTNSNDGFVGEFGTLSTGATASTFTITGMPDENPKITNTAAGVDAANGSFAVIKIKNNSNNAFLRISYPRATDPTRSIFKNQVISTFDSEFQTYIIDVTNSTEFVGTVNTIDVIVKLDADNNADGSGGTVEIDEITFTNDPPLVQKNNFAFDTDGDTEGWNGSGRVNTSATSGSLIADFTGGNNNGRINQETFGINADLGDFIHILVQNNSTNDEVRISYPDTENGSGFVFRTAPAGISATDFEVIDIDISSGSWNGIIEGFRVQFRQTSDGNLNPAGNAEIARILFDNNATLSETSIEKLSLEIYPNPVKDLLSFQTSEIIEKVVIYNMAGQKAFAGIPKSNTLNISELASGVYVAIITDSTNNTSRKKIIKN